MQDLIYAELEPGRFLRVDRMDMIDGTNLDGDLLTEIAMSGGYWLSTTLTPDEVFAAIRKAIGRISNG